MLEKQCSVAICISANAIYQSLAVLYMVAFDGKFDLGILESGTILLILRVIGRPITLNPELVC